MGVVNSFILFSIVLNEMGSLKSQNCEEWSVLRQKCQCVPTDASQNQE